MVLAGILIFTLSSCSSKVIMGSVEPFEAATHQDGIMSVKSWITGGTKNASYHAAQNALSRVLFDGVPGTAVKRPLFKGDRVEQKDYFDKLLSSPFDYVTAGSYSQNDRIKTSNGIKVGVVCNVRYKNLISRLERDNVIKAFGEW